MFAPVLITFVAFLMRIFNLGTPKGLVFDEVYYVDGARDYLKYGVELTKGAPEFVVHPPVGKWLIALGIKIRGCACRYCDNLSNSKDRASNFS
jgi:dolichyl-phosphate-mannose--protein O-mannosyl transferase